MMVSDNLILKLKIKFTTSTGESKVKSLQNTIKLIEDKVDVIIGPSSSEVSYLATQYLSGK